MKTIFLDVDGVLNFKNLKSKIEDCKVKLLKEIVDKTNSQIVLSSDWRYWLGTNDDDISLLIRVLSEHGMEIISSTPMTKHGYRGAEIHQWINEWQGEAIENFIILDDGDDMKPYMKRLVRTDFDYGLTEKDVGIAIALMNE